ncbi:hypothetical protein CALVIDRAFT_563275 [Calocera viscosa TUFC12733]|uniref:DUF6533 domain-containing protein n=1 Tax=Calocera viscosa (strain TUFC12733) TaxID=1330018 RepID=A0A167MTX8_CALVF|nr:hypothetical protein CALVIDRAFT_563275 [Calocera viscosa TUFC12733]
MSTTAPFDPSSATDDTAIRAQQYVALAGFCLMLYDMLITLDIEINLVWPAPRSFVKLLFLWNRYVTPCLYIYVIYTMSGVLNTPTDPNVIVRPAQNLSRVLAHKCHSCFEFILTTLTLEGISVNGVGAVLMLLRVHALYNRSKGILIILVSLLLLELVSSVVVMTYGILTVRDGMSFVEPVHACISTHHLRWLWIVFLFMILFDVVIFFLVVRKTWNYAKTIQAHTAVITALLFDAVGYFIVMMAAEFLNIIAYTTFPSNLFLIGIYLMWCLNTTMISRIYLNLRSAAKPEDWSSLTAFKTTYDPTSYATDDSGWTTYGSE